MKQTIESLTKKNRAKLTALEKNLGYVFKDRLLLQKALIHSSFAFEQGGGKIRDNETLEYLGDAVLDLAVGLLLFKRFKEKREGELTRLRASLVNESYLARMSQEIKLGKYLLLGKGESASNGNKKPSILCGAFEAVTGAIFLDSGFSAALEFVEKHFTSGISESERAVSHIDAKSRLQELIQEKHSEPPTYTLEEEEGPPHNRIFTVSVRFRDQVLAVGVAGSKKMAEQQAAAKALEEISKGKIDERRQASEKKN